MRSRSELIVPIRDRRSRRRIFTLKNFAKVAVVLVIVFVLLSFDWHRPVSKDYGRLFEHQVTPVETAKAQTPIVLEGKVDDQTAADPLLIEPAAREQALGVNISLAPRPNVPVAATPIAPASIAAAHEPDAAPRAPGTRGVVIVGDEKGVSIVKSAAPTRPLLSGGNFKQ
jgi:hypothetical protein